MRVTPISPPGVPPRGPVPTVVKYLAANAVAVGELLFFLCELHSGAVMDFDPGATTTAQVVYQAIIPLTARSGTSFAELLHGGGECHPDAMVSHAWGNLFSFLVAAVVAYAIEEPLYYALVPRLGSLERTRALISEIAEKHHDALFKKVWLCIFGVNQHVSICPCHELKYRNGDPLCQMDKFGDMIRFMHGRAGDCFQQVIALGVEGLALSRAWVVCEIHTCKSLGMVQCARIRFPLRLGDEGLRTAIRRLDVRECDAKRIEDKVDILAAIENKDEYNRAVQKILEEAVGLKDAHQRYQWLGVLALWASAIGGCALFLAFFPDPLSEKVAVLVALVCLMPFSLVFASFGLEYQFIFRALQDADRHGLCHEVFQQVPRGPWWSSPLACAWRRIAAACHAAPGHWQRLGHKILVVAMSWYILGSSIWVCNGLGGPGTWRATLAGYVCQVIAAVFATFSNRMLWRSDYPTPFKRLVLYPLLVAFWLFAWAFAWYAGFRWGRAAASLWSVDPLERVFLAAALALNAVILCQSRLFLTWQACRPGPEGKHVCKSAEIAQMRDRVHEAVVAWAGATLRISGLSRDIEERDLEDFCGEFGPLVGTFLALDSGGEHPVGTATVTFENEAHAANAIDGLPGCMCKNSAMQVEWAGQPRS